MTIHVDAEACPVRDIVLALGRRCGIEVVFYASLAHNIPEESGSRVVVVDQRSQEADIRIANAARLGDVVVTGDLGLASMCLARGAVVLDFRGEELDATGLPSMLEKRHEGVKVRRGGGRTSGPRALTQADKDAFRRALAGVIGGDSEP